MWDKSGRKNDDKGSPISKLELYKIEMSFQGPITSFLT